MATERERYSRVTRRMWRDERFRALSSPKPNAQTLWLFLLTGPVNVGVPGVLPISELGLSDQLGWPVAATRRCLSEIETAKMVLVDRRAPLIWIPKAIQHNPPANPNVVLSWVDGWRELPECELRRQAEESTKDFLKGFGKGFAVAFEKVLRKPSATSFDKQEQEQEQEQEGERAPARTEPPKAWAIWQAAYRRRYGTGYAKSRKDTDVLQSLSAQAAELSGEPERVLEHWFDAYLADVGRHNFLVENRHPLRHIEVSLASYGLPIPKPVEAPHHEPPPMRPSVAAMPVAPPESVVNLVANFGRGGLP
jgi:hypothetical protein